MDFKTLWNSFIFRPNMILKGQNKKKAFNSKVPVKGSIYGDTTEGEALKREHILHHWLKYKLIVPGVWFVRKLIGKQIDVPTPDKPYNKNFKIVDEAFEKAAYDWVEKYTNAKTCSTMTPEQKNEYILKNINNPMGSIDVVRNLWKTGKYVCLNDSVYREFFNMWVYEIGIGMAKEYKDKEVLHPLYNSCSIYHPNYIQIWTQIDTAEQMSKKPLLDQERWILQKLADNEHEKKVLSKDLDLIRFRLEKDLQEDIPAIKKELKLHLEKLKQMQDYKQERSNENKEEIKHE